MGVNLWMQFHCDAGPEIQKLFLGDLLESVFV